MPAALRLTLTDYLDPTHWRWVLSDARGGFLADHTVRLDPGTREYRGFLDQAGYLDFYREAYPPERQLADLGPGVGAEVFGGLQAKRSVPVHIIVSQRPGTAPLSLRTRSLPEWVNRPQIRHALHQTIRASGPISGGMGAWFGNVTPDAPRAGERS
ncbi:MAG: hypothetical protein H6R26_3280 [Proteobacteria bacterium]|nr:hypothetical protein [Pseudomonadota bacterium]